MYKISDFFSFFNCTTQILDNNEDKEYKSDFL